MRRDCVVILVSTWMALFSSAGCKNACWSCLGDALARVPLQGQQPLAPEGGEQYETQDVSRKVCYTNTITLINQTNRDYQVKLDGYMIGWLSRYGRIVLQSQISGSHAVQVKDQDERWSPVHSFTLDCQYQPNYNYHVNYY